LADLVSSGACECRLTPRSHGPQTAGGSRNQGKSSAKPGDLPIEQATKFQLFINLKTAKARGFVIFQSILVRANEVIQ
jgi:hypothetical protein